VEKANWTHAGSTPAIPAKNKMKKKITKVRCLNCLGHGIIDIKKTKCPRCKGTGIEPTKGFSGLYKKE
jgi:Zn finger protein HypA/HybF involved in hydrogenase expression